MIIDKRIMLLFMSVALSIPVLGQVKILGRTIDTHGKPIPNVSVSYTARSGATILGFTVTDEQGQFGLTKREGLDSIVLVVSHLGYRSERMTISTTSGFKTIVLTASPLELREIQVQRIPIVRIGDTISYDVSSFKTANDRAIGDVIKNLPGIEMNGKAILYQGKPIQKFYVNGLDLMEGKYAMVNENLPADAVAKVQILENHQPIKILDSLVHSDRASLNIRLKRFTSTGMARIGTGLAPFLWDVALTPMTFNKSFQSLNSLQSNNFGNDITKQARTITAAQYAILDLSDIIQSEPTTYVYLNEVSSPALEENKWLDNHSNLASTNILQKLGNGLELKGNFSYSDNAINRTGHQYTSILAPGGLIKIEEDQSSDYRTRDFQGGVIVQKNEERIFLKNNLRVNFRNQHDIGNLLRNNSSRVQQLRTLDQFGIFNKFSIGRKIGKNLYTLNSYIGIESTPQRLSIAPGQFVSLFNAGRDYDRLMQDLHFRKVYTDNNIGFGIKMGEFSLTPSVGVEYERNDIESNLSIDALGQQTKVSGNYENNLIHQKGRMYINLNTQLSYRKFRFSLFTPVNANLFLIDETVNRAEHQLKLTFEPQLTTRFKISSNSEFVGSIGLANRFGPLSNLYTGYVLSSYRELGRQTSLLAASKWINSGLSFSTRNTIKASFFNIGYNFSRASRPFLERNSIQPDGLSAVEIIALSNSQYSHQFNSGLGKLISTLKTVVKTTFRFAYSSSEALVNDSYGKTTSLSLGGGLEINNSSFDWMGLSYKGSIGYAESGFATSSFQHSLYHRHQVDLNARLSKAHSLTFSPSYYYTDVLVTNQLFADLVYRIALDKPKLDLELAMVNLLNNQGFIQQFNWNYTLVESYFAIRPRQFMVTAKFKF